MSLIEATARLAETGATRLHPNYIWATLKDRDKDPGISAAFERALAQGTRESRLTLLRVLELKFIHDPMTSGLDILGPELSHHFRDFDWQEDDFPGDPKDRGEGRLERPGPPVAPHDDREEAEGFYRRQGFTETDTTVTRDKHWLKSGS